MVGIREIIGKVFHNWFVLHVRLHGRILRPSLAMTLPPDSSTSNFSPQRCLRETEQALRSWCDQTKIVA
jgi:hypothetical protein